MPQMARCRRLTIPIVILILAGCAGGPSATTEPSPRSSSPQSSSLSPSPAPSPAMTEAGPTPADTPAPSTAAVDTHATVLTGDLVVRVDDINPESGPAHVIPQLSVYADGSVIEVVDDPSTNYGRARYARLTSAGLERIRGEAGGSTTLRTDTPAGVRIATLASWLPASDWDISPDEDRTWVPARYTLSIRVNEGTRALNADIEAIWPLAEPVATFGEPIPGDVAPPPGSRQARCGVVPLADALAIQAGTRAAGPGMPRDIGASFDVGWSRESAWAQLAFEALTPDEAGCAAINWYP